MFSDQYFEVKHSHVIITSDKEVFFWLSLIFERDKFICVLKHKKRRMVRFKEPWNTCAGITGGRRAWEERGEKKTRHGSHTLDMLCGIVHIKTSRGN